MWTIDAPHEQVETPTRINPSRVLYYFDGPQIFQAKFGFFDAIFAKFDEFDDSDLWLAAFTDDRTVDLVINNQMSVRGAFLSGRCWVIQTNPGLTIERFWACQHSDLTDDMLPDSGVALSYGMDRKPDSVEQANAFFSIGFKGTSLSHNQIRFSTFRSLIQSAHETVRKILTPPELISVKKDTLDFDIYEPKLGSLIIAIKEPLLSDERLSRYSGDARFDEASVGAEMEENCRDFLTDIKEIVENTTSNENNDSFLREKLGTLSNINQLLPDPNGLFQTVEFSASFGQDNSSVLVDEFVGRKLHDFYKESIRSSETAAGIIQIINAPSRLFTIITADGRQITCQVSPKNYSELRKNRLFRQGSSAVVTGSITIRSRRDFMQVRGMPIIVEPT